MAVASSAKSSNTSLDERCINTIRFLSIDAIQKANSGHPGLPMGAASMAYALWTRHLRHNPANPNWFDRDRFVLSAGHGSMLLYSMLHLTGYDLTLDDIKAFRQWRSRTPGHPERGHTPGVETTTGPLGQGFANGVGMAMAEAHLAATYNRDGFEVIRHFTYGIVSDGDLMEGIAAEAASLAGHLKLGRLIYLYDDNQISLAGGVDLTFTEDRGKRFESYGWHVQHVENGNDVEAIDRAIAAARDETERPSMILVRTHIGYGSPNKQDSFESHGSPLGVDEVKRTKENLDWPLDPPFWIPDDALSHFRRAIENGKRAESDWNRQFAAYESAHPESAKALRRAMAGELSSGWDRDIPCFPADAKGMATRVASGKILNAIAGRVPTLLGGSADLNPSTHTAIAGAGDFQSAATESAGVQGAVGGGWSYTGRNIAFGVREHAMGGIANGMAAHGGAIPYTSTFLIFSDYMRPSIRLASLMRLQNIYVFTHDGISVGEDGPTHQPIEQLASLRTIPGLVVIRPCDANETAVAWRVAIASHSRPVALALTRQNVPTLDRSTLGSADGLQNGAYILKGAGDERLDLVLMASGSEVHLAMAACDELAKGGAKVRVVSVPSVELFREQPAAYRNEVLPDGVPQLAIEAGVTLGWRSYFESSDNVVGVDQFGASAPGDVVMREYGFTVENVCRRAETLLNRRG
ncbi:MAG: transketolase [Phycisphaerales bacterium]|nr:transketolase [Phycisphaerales bacterium]MCB9863194.1 transketolase [Phycisphaerales bacterium]